MRQKRYWLGSLVLFASSCTLIFFLVNNEQFITIEAVTTPVVQSVFTSADTDSKEEQSPIYSESKTASKPTAKRVLQPVANQLDQAESHEASVELNASEADSKPVESETMAILFNQVAADYKLQASFPPFSQPIRSAGELERYLTNVPHATEIPYPLDDNGEYRARIELDKFRYFTHEIQHVQVSTEITPGVEISNTDIQIVTLDQRILYSQSVERARLKNSTYEFSVNLSNAWQPDWPTDLQWRVRSEIANQRLSVVAPFQVVRAVANVNGIKSPVANGAFFDLPMEITTNLDGYYFVQGIVYYSDGTPLMFLATEGPITRNSAPLTLQIYGPALLEVGFLKDLYLANIEISRLADETGVEQFGEATQQKFFIPDLDFTLLSDELWQDPLFAERLEFLTNLTMNEEN